MKKLKVEKFRVEIMNKRNAPDSPRKKFFEYQISSSESSCSIYQDEHPDLSICSPYCEDSKGTK